MKTHFQKSTPQSGHIVVAADGCRNIPTLIAIQLVRDLFEGIGVDRLRSHRCGMQLSFEDVSELADADLGEAIAAGLGFLMSVPEADRSAIKASLVKRIEAQLGDLSSSVCFRVGFTNSIRWPKPSALGD